MSREIIIRNERMCETIILESTIHQLEDGEKQLKVILAEFEINPTKEMARKLVGECVFVAHLLCEVCQDEVGGIISNQECLKSRVFDLLNKAEELAVPYVLEARREY